MLKTAKCLICSHLRWIGASVADSRKNRTTCNTILFFKTDIMREPDRPYYMGYRQNFNILLVDSRRIAAIMLGAAIYRRKEC